MPQVVLTTEEQDEYSKVSNDVDTYMDETIVKFIIGEIDPNDDAAWNEYVSSMKQLGTDTMLEVYQAALERYNGI